MCVKTYRRKPIPNATAPLPDPSAITKSKDQSLIFITNHQVLTEQKRIKMCPINQNRKKRLKCHFQKEKRIDSFLSSVTTLNRMADVVVAKSIDSFPSQLGNLASNHPSIQYRHHSPTGNSTIQAGQAALDCRATPSHSQCSVSHPRQSRPSRRQLETCNRNFGSATKPLTSKVT